MRWAITATRLSTLENWGKICRKYASCHWKSKDTTLPRFIFCFSIGGVGESTAMNLAINLANLQPLMAAVSKPYKTPMSVKNRRLDFWVFRAEHNIEVIESTITSGYPLAACQPNSLSGNQPLKGQSWVITGTLESMGRDEAKKLQALGAKVSGSVSANHRIARRRKAVVKLANAEKLG